MGSIASPANIMAPPGAGKFAFVLSANPSGPARADVPVQMPFPANYIRVVSCVAAALNNSLFWHLEPLGKSYSGLGTTMTGNERWVPMYNAAGGANQTKLGFTIKLGFKISQFYLDLGFEAGGADHNLVFLVTNDVNMIADQWA